MPDARPLPKVVVSVIIIQEVIIMDNSTKKVCTKCHTEKLLDAFNNQKAGKYGKRATCRECQNAENREYKKTERGIQKRREWKRSDVGKENSRRYRENNADKIREYWQTPEYKIARKRSLDNQRFGGNQVETLERDGYKCVLCGSDDNIQVHHKDESGRNKPREQQNNCLDNLITLCGSCHIKQHNPVIKRWSKA